jgi:ribosomal-protein-alanine N-acetyltransferase
VKRVRRQLPDAKIRVRLETPSSRRLQEFLVAVRRSRKLHGRWVSPPWTPTQYRAYLRRLRGPAHVGYLIRLRGSGELVGVVNISEIVRGAFRSAYLGYYAFTPFAGRGLMTEGLTLVIDDAFGALGLHRLEANVQPDNGASIRLVRRLGFRREGYSPRYLKINGRWRDHERWAILSRPVRRRRMPFA